MTLEEAMELIFKFTRTLNNIREVIANATRLSLNMIIDIIE